MAVMKGTQKLNMKFIIFALLLIFHSIQESVGTRPPPPSVTVDDVQIWSEIQSRFAITDVLAHMSNNGNADQEVKFTIDMPARAFITQFHMLINGRLVNGVVKPRDAAREEYEKAQSNDQNAGLVEHTGQHATTTFEISTNLAAQSQVLFNLTYQEVLQRVHGVYKHIINIRPLYTFGTLKINVLIAERNRITKLHTPKFKKNTGQLTNKQLLDEPGDTAIKTQSMTENGGSLTYVYYDGKGWGSSPDGQMVILYDVERRYDGGQLETLNGYFVHFIAPDGLDPGERDVIFAIDTSGSMKGRKIEQVKSALRKVINDLHAGDRFDIVTFANTIKKWKGRLQGATAQNKRDAITFVNGFNASGGTNINDALVQSLKELHDAPGREPLASMVILLTDGLPTVGERDEEIILRNTRAITTNKIEIVHAIAFGNDADYAMLKRLASQHGGVARKIYTDSDADIQLEGFYDEISSPILTDVDVKYLNGSVKPNSLTIINQGQTLNAGAEIVVVGATSAQSQPRLHADIFGRAAGGQVTRLQADNLVGNQPIQPCFIRPAMAAGSNIPDARHINMCSTTKQGPIADIGFDPSGFRGKRQASMSTAIGYIEGMWSYLTIGRLIEQSHDMSLSSSDRNQSERRALDLSLKYNFVTPLTSLVVIDNGQDNKVMLNRSTDEQPQPGSSASLPSIQWPPPPIICQSAAACPMPTNTQPPFTIPQYTSTISTPNDLSVSCRHLHVILAFDLAITGDKRSRIESMRTLAHSTINRVRQAVPYGNEIQFMFINFNSDRSQIDLTHKFADDQSLSSVTAVIDASLDGRSPSNDVSTFELLREMSSTTDSPYRMLIFTDCSTSFNRIAPLFAMLRQTPYSTRIGVASIDNEKLTSDRRQKIVSEIVGQGNERYIEENVASSATFDNIMSC